MLFKNKVIDAKPLIFHPFPATEVTKALKCWFSYLHDASTLMSKLLPVQNVHSVEQQQVETSSSRVRLHLRGRVWLQPELSQARRTLVRAASSPRPAPRFQDERRGRSGRRWRGSTGWRRGEAPHERAGGVHQGLDGAQRGDRQVNLSSCKDRCTLSRH